MGMSTTYLLLAIVVTIVQANNFSFPANSIWYQDVSGAQLDPNSAAILSYLDGNGIWNNGKAIPKFQLDFSLNIQYASSSTPRYTFTKNSDYTSPSCDDISQFPVTPNGAIEAEAPYNSYCDGDCHYIVVDAPNNKLYESFVTQIDTTAKTLTSTCGVVWDLCANYPDNLRGEQCTSADGAGFPIAPLLATADELQAGSIDHAMRFILPNAVMRQGFYVHPASHAGGPESTDPNAIIYGTRLRLKSSFQPSSLSNQPAPAAANVVIAALKKYGMFLSDGGNIPLSFADDAFTTAKYSDLNFDSHSMWGIRATDFEVISHSTPITLTYDCVRNTVAPGTCSPSSSSSSSASTPSTSSTTSSAATSSAATSSATSSGTVFLSATTSSAVASSSGTTSKSTSSSGTTGTSGTSGTPTTTVATGTTSMKTTSSNSAAASGTTEVSPSSSASLVHLFAIFNVLSLVVLML